MPSLLSRTFSCCDYFYLAFSSVDSFYLTAAERMKDWLLVVASLRIKSPSVAGMMKALESSKISHGAQRRLVLLDRDQLSELFGPTFVEKSRLFLEAPLVPKRKEIPRPAKRSLGARTAKRTLGGRTAKRSREDANDEQRAL